MCAQPTPFNIFDPTPHPNGKDYPNRLILVRHGETDWNRATIPQGHIDIPLNANGRNQAKVLATRLAHWQIDVIYSSDLNRAAETARVVGAVLGLEPHLLAEWREFDMGAWAGLTHAEIAERFPCELDALARGKDVARGGGETRADVQSRVAAAYSKTIERHPNQNVLVISHGGTLKILLGYLIGLAPENLDRLSTGGNTGISLVEYRMGQPRLTLLNDVSHLDCRDGC